MTRDYERWHEAYDDPATGLSRRLGIVQRAITTVLDEHAGPVRVLSSCAGDGRDILGVLAERDDAERVTATLIELQPALARRARESAHQTRAQVDVRITDAGQSDSYAGAVPADLGLLVGIFGNISDGDIERLISTAPQFCTPGATVIWSRGRFPEDRNDLVRATFENAGFTEIAYDVDDTGHRPAVGVVRFDGAATPLTAGRALFTFLR